MLRQRQLNFLLHRRIILAWSMAKIIIKILSCRVWTLQNIDHRDNQTCAYESDQFSLIPDSKVSRCDPSDIGFTIITAYQKLENVFYCN